MNDSRLRLGKLDRIAKTRHILQKIRQKKIGVPPESGQDLFEECNIFSIGSNDQWGFENEVVQKLPNCGRIHLIAHQKNQSRMMFIFIHIA